MIRNVCLIPGSLDAGRGDVVSMVGAFHLCDMFKADTRFGFLIGLLPERRMASCGWQVGITVQFHTGQPFQLASATVVNFLILDIHPTGEHILHVALVDFDLVSRNHRILHIAAIHSNGTWISHQQFACAYQTSSIDLEH